MKRRFVIGADFVPTSKNVELFIEGEVDELFGHELKDILDTADFRIFNLESPFAVIETPIPKQGPNLFAPIKAINGYVASGVNVLSLANNHILDQGPEGLHDTIRLLEKKYIGYLGAGDTYEDAAKPYFFEFINKRIGIYACAEHEFTIVSEEHAGANPFEEFESYNQVAEIKKESDYVVVLYHGGKEHYRYPSPELQKRCRKFIENGANLVVCQHSHCIGCEERYKDGTIVYGQGNFLFNSGESEYWNTGLLISVDENFEVSYIPLIKTERGVQLANDIDAKQIIGDFNKRTEEIKDEIFVKERYAELSRKALAYYLVSLSGKKHGIILRALNKITRYKFYDWYMSIKYNKTKLLAIKNFIECEAHRELILSGINEKLK